MSRIDGLVELQDALNAKNTQMAMVIAKHAMPKIAQPREAADAKGNVANAEVHYFDDPERIARYITWNAELDAASKDRSFALNAILIEAEMSPALLGLKEGAAPDAARKLRLEATNSLAMANRIGVNWKSGIRRALTVAQELENAQPNDRFDMSPTGIGVTMRDGIPIDELDQATTISTLRSAGVMSRRRAVGRQLIDEAAIDAEIEELADEAEAAMPATLLGTTPAGREPGEEVDE